MRFSEFMGQVPAITPSGARLDRSARLNGRERDPFATKLKRALAGRVVAQAEQKLGPLDLPEDAWPGVVRALGNFTEQDWRELTTITDLLPDERLELATAE